MKDQSTALHVLATKKNIIDPKMLESNFNAFMQMTNKEDVKPILLEFMKTCAYVGYTEGVNMPLLVQLFRRLLQTPAEVEDIDDLLNFMLMLALSNTMTSELDKKSQDFV